MELTVVTPTEHIEQKLTNIIGTTIVLPLSKFQETVYSEEIKLWIKDTKRLKASLTALYNVGWGQCKN